MNKHLKMISTVSVLALLTAYDNQPGWKLDADGKIEMRDGNPIFIDSSGTEKVMDGGVITRLNGEAQAHRTEKEDLQKK